MRLTAAALCSASILAAVAGLAGCRDPAGPPPCMPPTYTVSPAEARPGDEVTVRAQDTTCDARYGADARVQVTVRDAAGVNVLEELAPMTDDGGFTFVFTVPAEMAAGQAGVSAYPYGVDWCDDTGVNNRVASGPQALVRVSCAERLVPLVILAG
ncbi:hypothetical protein [Arthrobacter sp. HMWF013]|uniref:hypothetical protein n=1 Tax=Arthrobacter sp. HMWF013 TaxID=2056849 RepID=UPI002159C7A3|nr:hypothetical protein [Arthrobacter sp. HMWF013]